MTDLRFNTISFLSDFGSVDESVGVVHSVLRSLAPEVRVVDVTHGIETHDVRAAGLALARSVQYLAPGVVLGVVDPGAGSERKAIAIEVANGGAYLVGPDNGLFAPAVSLVGGATAAFVLDNEDYQLTVPAATNAGRDIFAPVAAHLCLGVPADELGTAIDPALLLPGVLPVSQTDDDGSIAGEVLWIDAYGNIQINVDPTELHDWPEFVEVIGGRSTRTAQRVDHFGMIPTGSIGLLVDSHGLVMLSVDRGSAAFDLELSEGDSITLRAADGPGRVASPVTITARPTTTPPPPEEH